MTEEDYKKIRESPYQAVLGKNPSRKELSEWTPQRWIAFLNFVEFHIEKSVRPKDGREPRDRYSITDLKVKELETFLLTIDHFPWAEFMFRINQFSWDGKLTKQYGAKFNTSVKIILSYLKLHPSVINDAMKEIIERNPYRMGWCMKQYYILSTPHGDTVQRDTIVKQGDELTSMAMPSIQKDQMEALVDMTDLHGRMVKEIKRRGFKSLETKDLYNALPKLVDSIVKMGKRSVIGNHFTQINISGGAREMEESMLDFVKQKNKDNE